MNRYIILTGIITVIIYSLIHLGRDFFSKDILKVFGLSTFMGFCVFKYDVFSWNKYLAAFFFFFISGVAAFYSKKILPAISESILHIVGMIYIYQLLLDFSSFNVFGLMIMMIPVIIIFYYCISTKTITNKEKVTLYSLFIFCLIYIDYFNLKMIALYDFPKNEPSIFDDQIVFSTIFASGILFYITIYTVNLLLVIPIRRKGESDELMKLRLKEDSALLISKFSSNQASPINTIVLSIFAFGIMILNIKYQLIKNNYLTEYFLGFILTCFQNKNNIYKIIIKTKKLAHHFT